MFAVSSLRFLPMLGCALMMLVCVGPMLSQRVRRVPRPAPTLQQPEAAPSDTVRADEIAALRSEVAELRAQLEGRPSVPDQVGR